MYCVDVCVCVLGSMIYVEEEGNEVTAYLWHYIVVTPRPLFPRERRFVIL
jgi:hypothetical protein